MNDTKCNYNRNYIVNLTLPKIVTASKAPMGTWLVSSFYERVNSVENQEVSKGNNSIAPDEKGMLETLRMIRDFMKFMREPFGHLLLRNLEDFTEDKE